MKTYSTPDIELIRQNYTQSILTESTDDKWYEDDTENEDEAW